MSGMREARKLQGAGSAMRRCVYTVLTGDYELLNEQPVARNSDIPFICFTENDMLSSESWEFRKIPLIFKSDPIRSQKYYKICPHRVLADFESSLYIDNSVILTVPPEEIFNSTEMLSGISLPAHSYRNTVEDEFFEVFLCGLDDPTRIAEQLTHYRNNFPDVLDEKPFWCAILLRNHMDPRVIAAMEIWLASVYRYSRRDQLSANVAFRQAGIEPESLSIDNYKSPFHSWPHISDRKERRVWNSERNADRIAVDITRAELDARAYQGPASNKVASGRLDFLARVLSVLIRH
jgi:hypothetical protein